MYKHHYSKFLSADPDRLHFAAHSHHYWPDATREAAIRYWDDTAERVDLKWEHILGQVVPEAQQHIAKILELDHPRNIAFAPNTHEFVSRLLSAFDWSRPLQVLTTDAEFYSFTRQINRLDELDTVSVTRVPVMPFESFEDRFKTVAKANEFDFVFLSQVFFDSGYTIQDLPAIVDVFDTTKTVVVIDGYHAFCAVPTSLKSIQNLSFYLGGGYKYAQCGEGACFLSIPSGCDLRPINTGWFADFDAEPAGRNNIVAYAEDAYRFFGSTFDPSGLYRFNAVMQWWEDNNLSVSIVHDYVMKLQDYFYDKIEQLSSRLLNTKTQLITNSPRERAHFITYQLGNAAQVAEQLKKQNIIVDSRGDRLRFGFGLYQSKKDIDRLMERLSTCL